jgi:hypothetical protein
MTVKELLQFILPTYEMFPQDQIDVALRLAEGYRPDCLTLDKQDEAQALYAAYLLETRQKRESGSAIGAVAGPIIKEKEGQLERQYADASANGGTYVDQSYYGRWKALSDVCAFGAIVTRFG